MSQRSRILIVEDNKEHSLALAIRLKANGFEVAFASDGAGAIRAALLQKPDLILLDLGLPAGDGFVVLERLKKLEFSITTPVIVISAREPNVNRARALEGGARAYLQKPVNTDELLQAVQVALDTSWDIDRYERQAKQSVQ